MNQWSNFEKKIGDYLSGFASDKLSFRNSYQSIIGFPSDGFRGDGVLTDGKILFAVEVEAGQTHPDTNVGKYWLLFEEYKKYSKIILFQVYTPAYNSYGWRMKLGSFYASKMEDVIPFEYKLFDFREETNFDYVFKKVKLEIQVVLKENFGVL